MVGEELVCKRIQVRPGLDRITVAYPHDLPETPRRVEANRCDARAQFAALAVPLEDPGCREIPLIWLDESDEPGIIRSFSHATMVAHWVARTGSARSSPLRLAERLPMDLPPGRHAELQRWCLRGARRLT